MHCQIETREELIAKNGNYVFCLKQNHKSLNENMSYYFESTGGSGKEFEE